MNSQEGLENLRMKMGQLVDYAIGGGEGTPTYAIRSQTQIAKSDRAITLFRFSRDGLG
jgi:hypothetical protein